MKLNTKILNLNIKFNYTYKIYQFSLIWESSCIELGYSAVGQGNGETPLFILENRIRNNFSLSSKSRSLISTFSWYILDFKSSWLDFDKSGSFKLEF